jgi:hypothetical protein
MNKKPLAIVPKGNAKAVRFERESFLSYVFHNTQPAGWGGGGGYSGGCKFHMKGPNQKT